MAVVLAASAAAAQPGPGQAAPADQAYQRGRAHYDLREWDNAIAEFKEAYRLRPDAPSLFNIAQSYRLKGDCEQALGFYKTYRRNFPNEKNIDRVDQFITEMDACAKAATTDSGQSGTTPADGTQATGGAQPTGGTHSTGGAQPTGGTHSTGGVQPSGSGAMVPPPNTFQPPANDAGRTFTIAGFGVAGLGVLCVIGSVVAGLRASSIEDEVQQLPVWDPSLHDKGENADLLAKILISVGGAAVITGGALLWVGHGKTESSRSTAVRVVPRGDGALVFVTGEL